MLNQAQMTESWRLAYAEPDASGQAIANSSHSRNVILIGLLVAMFVALIVGIGQANLETLGLNATTIGEQTVQGLLPGNPFQPVTF